MTDAQDCQREAPHQGCRMMLQSFEPRSLLPHLLEYQWTRFEHRLPPQQHRRNHLHACAHACMHAGAHRIIGLRQGTSFLLYFHDSN